MRKTAAARCSTCGCLPLEWLAVRTVAKTLSVSEMTVRRLIHDGSLEAARIGGCWRIRHASLDAYLQTRSSLGEEAER